MNTPADQPSIYPPDYQRRASTCNECHSDSTLAGFCSRCHAVENGPCEVNVDDKCELRTCAMCGQLFTDGIGKFCRRCLNQGLVWYDGERAKQFNRRIYWLVALIVGGCLVYLIVRSVWR